MDWNKICRTCLSTNNTSESIFSSPDPLALEYEYSASYLNMIKSVASISISRNDTLPQHICQKCINALLIAFNFQKIAIKTEESLKSLQTQEIEIPNDPVLLNHDFDAEEVKQEILSPNNNDFSVICDNGQKQAESIIEVQNPISTNAIVKLKQQTKRKKYKVICKKIQVKVKTNEKQSLSKNNISQVEETHQEQQNTTKPHEIKIKSLQSLQNPTNIQSVQLNNNLNAPKVLVPWVSPPPLVFLSESKTTPPPLVFLPNKTVETCKYCEMKFTTEFDLKVHLLEHEINFNSVSSCHFCWETPKDLLRHLKEHYKYLICAQCDIKFDTIQTFENHMKEHITMKNMKSPNIKPYRSNTCRICRSTSIANKNICLFCKNQENPICQFCGKIFTDYYSFVMHKRNH